MKPILALLLFLLPYFVLAQDTSSETTSQESKQSESHDNEDRQYKSANIVLEYNIFGNVGLDAAISKKLALTLRYGSKDLAYDQKSDSYHVRMKSYSMGLDYFVTNTTFSDSFIIGTRLSRIEAETAPNYKLRYQSKILENGDVAFPLQVITSYKWFSDRWHINGGPGILYDFFGQSYGVHFSFGVTF